MPVSSTADERHHPTLERPGPGRPARGRLPPLAYEELRKLAAQRMVQEQPGQTLQPTALVHEAYLRLVENNPDLPWTDAI